MQAVKRFEIERALRVKIKLKRSRQRLLMITQAVLLDKIVKRNVNLVLIWAAVCNFVKINYDGH